MPKINYKLYFDDRRLSSGVFKEQNTLSYDDRLFFIVQSTVQEILESQSFMDIMEMYTILSREETPGMEGLKKHFTLYTEEAGNSIEMQ